jgi:hypothetical protein
MPFGSAETKRKPQLRCTYQVAAEEALECFECRVLPRRDFGSPETKRKPQLRCTYQVAAVEALECFECRVLPRRDLHLYQLVVSVVCASSGGDTVRWCEGFGARLGDKIKMKRNQVDLNRKAAFLCPWHVCANTVPGHVCKLCVFYNNYTLIFFIFIPCKKIRYKVKQPTTCTSVFCF